MPYQIPAGLRKVLIYLSIALGCFLVIELGLHSPSNDYKSPRYWSILINEPSLQLRGLIHVLKTYPDRTLPEPADPNVLLTPHALGIEEWVHPTEWKKQIVASEKETPLVVFSKVSVNLKVLLMPR